MSKIIVESVPESESCDSTFINRFKAKQESTRLENLVLNIMSELVRQRSFGGEHGYSLFVDTHLLLASTSSETMNNYVSRNFKINANQLEGPDVVVVLSRSFKYCPVVIGVVKDYFDAKAELDLYQCFDYMLARQRPFCLKSSSSSSSSTSTPFESAAVASETRSPLLLGFLLDAELAYKFELSFGCWTDDRPVLCESINCYRIGNHKKPDVKLLVNFLSLILKRLTDELTDDFLREQVANNRIPLFRFPPSRGEFLRLPDHPRFNEVIHLLRISQRDFQNELSNYFNSNEDLIVYFPQSTDGLRTTHLPPECCRSDSPSLLSSAAHSAASSVGSSEAQSADPETVPKWLLKVYGHKLSGGLVSLFHLPRLLNSNRLPFLTNRYKAVFKIKDNHPFVFSISEWVEGNDCLSRLRDVQNWWEENRQEAREVFFKDVVQVAFEAIRLGFYHWDVRLLNILFTNEKRFVIIDWESVVGIEESGNFLEMKDTNLQSLASELSLSFEAKAYLGMFERLISCLNAFGEKLVPSWMKTFKVDDLEQGRARMFLENQMRTALQLHGDTADQVALALGSHTCILR